jgi:hypothetical protein
MRNYPWWNDPVLRTERRKEYDRLQEDTRWTKTQEAEENSLSAARGHPELTLINFSPIQPSTMASAELYQFYFNN